MTSSGSVVSDPWSESEDAGGDAYRAFYREVAARQLDQWLPRRPARVLDLSGAASPAVARLVDGGHSVVLPVPPAAASGHIAPVPGVAVVAAESDRLDWLGDAAVDLVVAESCALSTHLAVELTVGQLGRVLRAGGRLLLCVDSLLLGLARLAGLSRWAELADAPLADVVLVQGGDGLIRRCFGPDELAALLRDAGFTVDWVRPRSVISPEAVQRTLDTEPGAMARLVRTELALAQEREGESIGMHLLASARRR